MVKVLFFCWAFTGAVPPPSPSLHRPDNCTLGAWLKPDTIIMPGTYDSEDTRRQHRSKAHVAP